MALILSDRVKETTTTTGTGTYTLGGAVVGFESFASIGNSNTTYYCCTNGTDFEVGIGTYTSSGTTLARTTILQSSNSDSAVNWSVGTKEIFCTLPAEKVVVEDASNNINGTFVGNITGNVTGNASGTAATVTGAAQTNITSLGTLTGLTIDGDATFTGTNGNIVFDKSDDSLKFPDNVTAKFGTGADLQIYHDGSDSYIQETGTGNLNVRSSSFRVRTADNSAFLLRADTGGFTRLYYNGSQKLTTEDTGVDIVGTLTADGITLGDSELLQFGASNDLTIQHNGNNSFISDSGTGALLLTTNHFKVVNPAMNENMINALEDSQVELYYNGNKKLETTSGGIEVTGTVTDDGAIHDGDVTFTGTSGNIVFDKSDDSLNLADNVLLKLGADGDLVIRHNGSNSLIEDNGGGSLIVKANPIFKLEKSGTSELMLEANADGAVELYYNNEKKFETRSNGFAYVDSNVNVEITNQSNHGAIEIGGTNGAFIDFKSPQTDDFDARIQVNTSNLFAIYSDDLHLASKTAETYLDATANGAINLYHDNVKTFETTADGIKVTAPNLGTSNGDTETVADFFINNGNGSSLRINKIRDGNGTNWNTSATKIQQVIDTTHQGYIQFNGNDNQYGIELGTVSDEKFFRGIYNGAVELYHDNSKKFETTSDGATVTGTLVSDVISIADGSSTGDRLTIGTNDDFFIYHDGQTVIANVNGSGPIKIQGKFGEQSIVANQDGSVELHHDGTKKFETTATGATVTGTLVADGVSLGDNDILKIGNSDDFQILHNGSQTALNNLLGNVIFRNFADDADIDIMSDDGSGGTTTYFRADGSTGEALLYHYGTEKFKTTSTGATVTGNLELLSTDAGASSAPLIELYRHSASPDTADFLGRIDFYGEDDNDDKLRYAAITSSIFEPTNGNERGRLELDIMQNGNMTTFVELAANGIFLNKPTTITGDTLITNADADADADPTLTLRRTSASPAFNDQLGELVFKGRNSAAENVNYGRITTKIATVTDGNEGGNLSFNVLQGGSEAEFMQMAFDNIFVNKQITMFNNIFLDGGYGIIWDGATNDSNTTTLVVTDPTAVRTITLPDASGTVVLQDSNGDATIGGGLTVTGGNSGDALLTFATDRSWQFQQLGDDGSTRLQLKSNVDSKLFDICASDGSITHTFFTSTTNPSTTLTSYDADANQGPILILNRNSASPAVNDLIGQIQFVGEDSVSSPVVYGAITGIITDPTNGSEDGLIRFQGLEGGNLYTAYQIGYSANFFYRDLHLMQNVDIRFEGSTDDNFETLLTVTDPTADRTITLPNATGTVLTTGNSDTPATTTSSSDADFVLIDDGGTMKKITPSNLGIGSGGGSFNGTLTSTDAGAEAGPILTLDRNSSSPADDDILGAITFKGRNDAGETIEYASFQAKAADVTDATEDGRLLFKIHQTDELKTVLDVRQDSFKLNNVSKVVFGDPISQLIFEGATGDAHELTLNITDPTADRTIAVPDASGTIALKSEYFQAFRSSNSANLTSSFATIDFDTVTLNSDNSVLVESGGEVTINKTGIFRFASDVTTKITSGSDRSDCEIELQKKPSGGSFSAVTGTTGMTYNRNSSQGEQTASINFMVSVTSGDAYRVVVRRQGGTDTIVVQANAARFNIQEVN